MLSVSHYVILWSILFTIIGAVWYNLDRLYGVKLYRRWYNLTHKDPLPDGEHRGFVYKRSVKARFTAAWVVSTLQSLVVISTTPVNLLVEFVMWIFEVPITMLGFYLGPYTYRLWRRKDDMFEALDRLEHKVEEGEFDLAAKARKASRVIREHAGSLMGPGKSEGSQPEEPEAEPQQTESARPAPADEAEPPAAEPSGEQTEDARELMRSYARKRERQRGERGSD